MDFRFNSPPHNLALPLIRTSPSIHSPTCLFPLQQRGTWSNTIFPQRQLPSYATQYRAYIVQRLRIAGLKYAIDEIHDCRLEELTFFQRDERVMQEHTVLGIIAPDAPILVQSVPKSLAAGAPPQTPLVELTALPQTP